MRLSTISIMSFAGAAICGLATPAAAQEVRNYTGYGANRAAACSDAKSNAGDLYTVVRFSACECSDNGPDAARNYRWECSVDAYVKRKY